MIDRSDSPWYSTARLFRQRYPGAWDAVLADVAGALSARLRIATGAFADPVGGD
jgi:hypothetical protein